MVGPIRFDGLASGIDFTTIIDKLLEVQRRPLLQFSQRIEGLTGKKAGLLSVSANLLAIQSAVSALSKPSFLNRTKASSSNEGVLTASGDQIAVTGAFSFRVAKIAQAHGLLSNGFSSSSDVVTSSASSIRIEVGNGFLDRQTSLAFLNGQAGVDRGSIKITDTQGNIGVVNLEAAATLGDVVDAINSGTDVSVQASLHSDRILIEDLAGGGGALKVENFGADTTATDLGIAGTGVDVAGQVLLFGDDVNVLAGTSPLRLLNDGLGVRRNTTGASDFKVVGKQGGVDFNFNVDIGSTVTTIQGVVDAINTAAGNGGKVAASLNEDGTGLRLNGGVAITNLTVSAASDSLAAADLGFGSLVGGAFSAVTALNSGTGAVNASGSIVIGNRITAGLNSILRNALNGGQEAIAGDLQGVGDGTIKITDKSGAFTNVNLARYAATTLASGSAAGLSQVKVGDVTLFAPGNKIRLVGGGKTEYRTVTRISGSTVFFDKALDDGFAAGAAASAVNESLDDIRRLVNFRASQAGVDVTLGFNKAGNGLLATDTSGGTGLLKVEDVAGTAASDLQIDGTSAGTTIQGTDLDPQYVGENVKLSTLNSGNGVASGKFRVTDRSGTSFNVNIASSTDTIGEAIEAINIAATDAGSLLTARVNDTGDGILLNDPGAGTGLVKVADLSGGSAARDLNLAGTADSSTPGTIDGAYEFSVGVKANAKVSDVVNALNSSRAPVRATLINTNNPVNPVVVSLQSRITGSSGRLVVDPQFSGMSFTTSAKAQDAALLYGADGSEADPILVESSSNRITNVVTGMTLELKAPSPQTIVVTVSKDIEGVAGQVKNFVDSYNKAMDTINELTKFDFENNIKGVLFGESVLRRVKRDLADIVNAPVAEIPSGDLRSLPDVGISFGPQGKLVLDESKLNDVLNTDFDEAVTLFTKQKQLSIGVNLSDFHRGLGVRSVAGNDMRIVKRNGEFFDVDLSSAQTVGSVESLIKNNAGNGGDVDFGVSTDGFSLVLTDNSLQTRTANGGSTTTLVENDFQGSPVSFVGATITFDGAANNPNAVVTVASFNAGTGTFTFNETLSNPVLATDNYVLERPFEVTSLNNSPGPADLGIRKKAALGDDTITGNIITLLGAPGKMFQLSDRLDFITKPAEGLISTRVGGIDDNIKGLEKSIQKGEDRIKASEERLIKEFARLEGLISESQQTMSRLQAQQTGMLLGGMGRLSGGGR